MSAGGGNPVSMQWKYPPDLLFNDESLLDIILTLRTKIEVLEKNEMGSGEIPQWLTDAMQNIANNSEAMVECQSLKDQLKYMKQNIDALQKDIVILRRDVVAAKTLSKRRGGNSRAGDDEPERGEQSSRRGSALSAEIRRGVTINGISSTGHGGETPSVGAVPSIVSSGDVSQPSTSRQPLNVAEEAMKLTVALQGPADGGQAISSAAMEQLLEPVVHSIERQKEEFAVMRENSQAAKDSVMRLQAEMKRRDALIQARNSKHEASVKILMDKLNHDLRACVTHNEMIGFEQKMIVVQKQELSRLNDEFSALFGRIQEDLYMVRSSQEDINSAQAEAVQTNQSKIQVLNERLDECQRNQDRFARSTEELKRNIQTEHQQIQTLGTQSGVMKDKLQALAEKQAKTEVFCSDMSQALENVNTSKVKSDENLKLVIHQRAESLYNEIKRIDDVLESCSLATMADDMKSCTDRLTVVGTLADDNKKRIAAAEQQIIDHETINNTNFTNIYEGMEKARKEATDALRRETTRLGTKLVEHGDVQAQLGKIITDVKTDTERNFAAMRTKHETHELETDAMRVNTEAALQNLKEKIFFCEEANLALRAATDTMQLETKSAFASINTESKSMHTILDSMNLTFDDLGTKQTVIEKQLDALQHDFRCEITVTTAKLSEAVAKEGQRTEALYAAFAEKQAKFAEIVAKSSTRNMPIATVNKELDKLCDAFVNECWKFEISPRQEGQTGPPGRSDNNGSSRKQFSERQQVWVVKNCQFFADLICAKAEYDIMRTYSNKDTKTQSSLETKMIRAQAEILENLHLRIEAKISNNKNCGEQFDRSTIERREVFVETIHNLTDGALARRTLMGGGGVCSDDSAAGRGSIMSLEGSLSCMESVRLQSSGRPSTNGFESPSTRAMKRMSDVGTRPDTTTGGGSGPTGRRMIQSPHANSPFVFRGGFRIPHRSTGLNAVSDAYRELHADDEHSTEEFEAEDEGIHCELSMTPSVSLPAL
ncbi:hypothetical protein, variant 1 [Aphanomyces invadans]|uniref:Uncharacterized protein n=1 Tax=Aphanomyces invadans TaxID=157072 RepID=A0A024UQ74_9STRA|nr:hypothetical protein, variant 1 [Aphanomyces invadans]ETW08596.1 hypothetical protein, variant 1 [Aphanomyces invadans]|eukprot:XP_008862401.1 hypothetical protein, variant 1 [Aphanomyces invadans]